MAIETATITYEWVASADDLCDPEELSVDMQRCEGCAVHVGWYFNYDAKPPVRWRPLAFLGPGDAPADGFLCEDCYGVLISALRVAGVWFVMGADSERLAAITVNHDGPHDWLDAIRGRAAISMGHTADGVAFRVSVPLADFDALLLADTTWRQRLRAVEAERDVLLALVDDACASDDLTVLRDWQTERLLKETQQ